MGTAEFTALLLLLTQFPIPPHVTPRCPSLYFARCSPASSREQDQSRAGRNMGQGRRKTAAVSSLLHLHWFCCRAAGAELACPPWAAFYGRRGANHLFASAPKPGSEQRHTGTKLQFYPGGGGNGAHKRQHRSRWSLWAPIRSSQPCLQPARSSSSTALTHIHLATLGTAPASSTSCQRGQRPEGARAPGGQIRRPWEKGSAEQECRGSTTKSIQEQNTSAHQLLCQGVCSAPGGGSLGTRRPSHS